MRYVLIFLQHGLIILSLTSGTFLLLHLPLVVLSWRSRRRRTLNLSPHFLRSSPFGLCGHRFLIGRSHFDFSCVLGLDFVLIIEHCSILGRNGNFSSFPFMLKRITPAPTSMCVLAVLRNGRPRMSGVSFDISMSSTTKSTGMK